MANKHMKRCSTGKCKSKPQQDTSSHSLGCLYQKDSNEKPGILLVGKVVQVALENHMAVSQKFEHGVTYDSAIPFLSMYPRKMRTCPHRNHTHSSITQNSQKSSPPNGDWKTKCGISMSWNTSQ